MRRWRESLRWLGKFRPCSSPCQRSRGGYPGARPGRQGVTRNVNLRRRMFRFPQLKRATTVKFPKGSTAIAATMAIAAAGAASAAPTLRSVKAGTYKVESYHTQVEFSVSHFGFTYYSGFFSGATGSLDLDPKNLASSKLNVVIPVRSIMTTVPILTNQLMGGNWFYVEKYPQATFTSAKVTPAANGEFTIRGNLTLHGVTRPVTLHAHFVGAGVDPIDKAYTVGFQAQGLINRLDFGVSMYAPAVGEDVRLTIAGAFELKR